MGLGARWITRAIKTLLPGLGCAGGALKIQRFRSFSHDQDHATLGLAAAAKIPNCTPRCAATCNPRRYALKYCPKCKWAFFILCFNFGSRTALLTIACWSRQCLAVKEKLAVMLCTASLFTGCAARHSAEAEQHAKLAIPVNCITRVDYSHTKCQSYGTSDQYVCRDVLIRAGCVKAQR